MTMRRTSRRQFFSERRRIRVVQRRRRRRYIQKVRESNAFLHHTSKVEKNQSSLKSHLVIFRHPFAFLPVHRPAHVFHVERRVLRRHGGGVSLKNNDVNDDDDVKVFLYVRARVDDDEEDKSKVETFEEKRLIGQMV